jgi:hypothetical protein
MMNARTDERRRRKRFNLGRVLVLINPPAAPSVMRNTKGTDPLAPVLASMSSATVSGVMMSVVPCGRAVAFVP